MKAGANDRRRRASRTDRKRKTKGERRPFRPHARFGKGRKTHAAAVLAAAALAAMTVTTANPQEAAADEPPPNEDWEWLDGIEFQPPEPIPGRRLFVHGIAASNGRARVELRAATDIDLHVHAYGGHHGSRSLFSASAALQQGERVQYDMPLDGPRPSLEFSWQDSRAQAGTLALDTTDSPIPCPPHEDNSAPSPYSPSNGHQARYKASSPPGAQRTPRKQCRSRPPQDTIRKRSPPY